MENFYDYWLKLGHWNSKQAAFLLNRKDPSQFSKAVIFPEKIEDGLRRNIKEWQRQVYKTYSILESAKAEDWRRYVDMDSDTYFFFNHPREASPDVFVSLAMYKGIEIPEELKEACFRRYKEIDDANEREAMVAALRAYNSPDNTNQEEVGLVSGNLLPEKASQGEHPNQQGPHEEAPEDSISIPEMFDQEPRWYKWPPPSGLAIIHIAICYAVGRHPAPPNGTVLDPDKEDDYKTLCELVESAIILGQLKANEKNSVERVVVTEFYQWLKDQGDEYYSELHPEFIARDPSLPDNQDDLPTAEDDDTTESATGSTSSSFDGLPINAIAKLYPFLGKRTGSDDDYEYNLNKWRGILKEAYRKPELNALVAEKRQGRGGNLYDPYKVGSWAIENAQLKRSFVCEQLREIAKGEQHQAIDLLEME